MDAQTGTTQTPGVSKLRYAAIISASILIMLCSGAVYAWSIFVAPLQSEFGFSTTQTQLVYGLIIALFTVGMLFVNKVLRRYGPRTSAVIGAVFFCSGYMVASFSGGNLVMIIIGMSLLSGIGMAFGYVTVLNNLVKWFPRNKGLATGLAVSGFGGGAILLSQIARPLIAGGWHVMDIFRTVGIVYGVLFLAGALVLTVPSWYKPDPSECRVRYRKMLADKRFWILFYVFFAGTFAGLLFNGNLNPIGQSAGVSSYAAVLAISLFSIGNAAGRIIWGQVHDMIGGRMAVMLSLSLLTGLMLLLLIGSGNDILFMLLTLFLGLTFGANFVTYASDVSDHWGIARLDIVYPAVSVAYGIAGILGPIAGGFIRDTSGSYHTAIILGAVICATGIAVYGLLMPHKHKLNVKESVKGTSGIASSKRTG
ncbi:MAG: MFS transporter [Dehalococcoidales bacterium]|nr:MFS transporter [Dehalococcoidales bacterium]